MKSLSPRGFTLLELLVVIFLIAILSALLIPVIRSHREASRRTQCASNLNQIAKALYMYADIPASGYWPSTSTTYDPFNVPGSTLPSLNLLYNSYVQDPRIFSCPSMPVPSAALQKIVPTKNGRLQDGGAAMVSSYGYDPGRCPNDAIEALMADKKGSGSNSDSHGPNAGQNVLIGAGTVEFRDHVKNPVVYRGYGKIPPGDAVFDDDIYSLNSKIDRIYDCYIRQ